MLAAGDSVVHLPTMNRRLPLHFSATYWRALSGVLLLVYLVRAVIPAGYMPAHFLVKGGSLPGMTICVQGLSASTKRILALEEKRQTEPQMLDCAVGFVTSQAALSFTAAPAFISVVADLQFALWLTAVETVQLAVRGPPLGSRAPPF
ncbi:hypothetical protein EKL30_17490 [Candidimonas sp. SYP-B2681]|uniref:hypothetical protein n=1 Tax=Candidimonas sp. SYP-B2681 TaxID=2497686 RepID=UPI000F87D270|nr:hypothetical protein [Candidimonas sp. SYP-B2681]RTZ40046.1 hypothetical protein EKL30_17490 [Candidimonas sp. SYP-B2681]